ncbi:MAG: UbiD family decarboxylase [Pirellulales bacterium]|nr:UbiD family decarboxylase [Pirellulales bacterium]
MGYRTLRECINDLERHGHLARIDAEVDAGLEIAEIQRRVFAAGGPALLFSRVKHCGFPVACNLFGTIERAQFMFRDTLERVRRMIELKIDPLAALRQPLRYASSPLTAVATIPKYVARGEILAHETAVSRLPRQISWPGDGGAFITLPQVYTEDVSRPGWRHSNLGMYRIQISGGRYEADREIGLHYQLHRSIGVHHAAAVRAGQPFRVNVFVGGPPAMMLAAVMPLPEGMSELTFAGALGGHRIRMVRAEGGGLPIHADTDFAICGTVVPNKLLPEGPFGDHLGYYSLEHEYPVLRVERVLHRPGAIWPLTVVGRPPQEDTIFGQLIHELTGPVIPTVLPGVKSVHAVDAAGVHPLLLAIGSERYQPFAAIERPQELLTQANAILGQGQLSLAKFLLIANEADDSALDIHDVAAFMRHMLRRGDWSRDLHFHTQTTMDTLDYSGDGINAGSKVVIAAVGPPRFELLGEVPAGLQLPSGFGSPRVALPGILVVQGPPCELRSEPGGRQHWPTALQTLPPQPQPKPYHAEIERFCGTTCLENPVVGFRWIVVVDDSAFAAASLNNFLWVTFTRTNPAADVHGIASFSYEKHWGCHGPLVLDARLKPHHASPLVEDAEITRRVEALAARGGPLHGLF